MMMMMIMMENYQMLLGLNILGSYSTRKHRAFPLHLVFFSLHDML